MVNPRKNAESDFYEIPKKLFYKIGEVGRITELRNSNHMC